MTTPASISASARPLRIAITTGEPAGVGPELMYYLTQVEPSSIPVCARCVDRCTSNATAPIELVLIGDKELLQERMSLCGKDFKLHDFDPEHFTPSGNGTISVLHTALGAPSVPGTMDIKNAQYVLTILDIAIDHCMKKIFDAMVTGPISKSIIAQTGITFTGHTEYLEEQTKTEEVVMMLGCQEMNVALVTTHLPLREVPDAITPKKLTDIITVLHHDLQNRLGFEKPIIYVCGLNPHAGEDGTLGTEERDIMQPVLEKLRREQHFDLRGPLPADTLFQPKYLDEAAAVLTMYHDQGLPVLKYAGFDKGYNTTLGLPFIRTSVDHGTAFDLAGKAQANPGSLLSAVSLAIYMAQHHKRNAA